MKGKNCLHCGIISSVCKVRAGLCDYCKSVVTENQRKIYAEINNGKISYCYLCDELTRNGETYSDVKTDYILTTDVCAACDKAFATVT